MCGKQFLENIFLPVEMAHSTHCQHSKDAFLDSVLTLCLSRISDTANEGFYIHSTN